MTTKRSTSGLRTALAEYDATQSARDAMFDMADSSVFVDACIATEALALIHVQRAFHALTSHINSWHHAKLADITFMRQIAARETI